jgi:DNA-binding MarR family transcriptional regulator
MRAVLAPHDLTHVQFVLLASLWWLTDHGDGPPTQARLAEQAGIDPMMTSQVLRRLEARGLLKRAPDPTDSRALQLRLTSAGRTLVAGALADVEAADDEYFAALGGEREAFVGALAVLGARPLTEGEDRDLTGKRARKDTE